MHRPTNEPISSAKIRMPESLGCIHRMANAIRPKSAGPRCGCSGKWSYMDAGQKSGCISSSSSSFGCFQSWKVFALKPDPRSSTVHYVQRDMCNRLMHGRTGPELCTTPFGCDAMRFCCTCIGIFSVLLDRTGPNRTHLSLWGQVEAMMRGCAAVDRVACKKGNLVLSQPPTTHR